MSATKDEIELWALFEPDIFQYVKGDDIWFNPDSGERLTRCPFLEIMPPTHPQAATKYTCSIYLSRPEDCRHYPSLISEMIRDECEMIEAIDLGRPTQAQKELDVLMQDSRPSSS